jgi:hypothetical protein
MDIPREILGDDFRWRDRHAPLTEQSMSLEQLYQMFLSRFLAEMVAAQEDIAHEAAEEQSPADTQPLTMQIVPSLSRTVDG